jgi:hypothetical protein
VMLPGHAATLRRRDHGGPFKACFGNGDGSEQLHNGFPNPTQRRLVARGAWRTFDELLMSAIEDISCLRQPSR